MDTNFHKSVPESVKRDYKHLGDMMKNIVDPDSIKWPAYVLKPLENLQKTGKITLKQVHKIQHLVFTILQKQATQSKKRPRAAAKKGGRSPSSTIPKGNCDQKVELACKIGRGKRRFVTIKDKNVYID